MAQIYKIKKRIGISFERIVWSIAAKNDTNEKLVKDFNILIAGMSNEQKNRLWEVVFIDLMQNELFFADHCEYEEVIKYFCFVISSFIRGYKVVSFNEFMFKKAYDVSQKYIN